MEAGVRHSPAPRAVFTVPWVRTMHHGRSHRRRLFPVAAGGGAPFFVKTQKRRRGAGSTTGHRRRIATLQAVFRNGKGVTDAESPPNAPAGSLWLLWPVLPLCPGGPRPAIWLSRLGAVRGAAPQPSRPWAPA